MSREPTVPGASESLRAENITLRARVAQLERLLETRGERGREAEHDVEEPESALALYRLLAGHSNGDIALLFRLDGRLVRVNDAAPCAYGYTTAELGRMNIADLRAPGTLAELREQLRQAERLDSLRFETVHQRKDGSQFPVEVSWVSSGSGPERLILSVVRDITERKRAEEALRESEQRLEIACEAAEIGIHDFDVETGAIRWDARLRRIWGVPEEETVTYETFLQGLHPDDRERTDAIVAAALDPAGPARFYVEYRIVNRGSRAVHWVAATGRVFFAGGRAVRLVGTAQDITERKRTEEALRLSEQRFRDVFEHAPTGIAIADTQGHFLKCNAAYAQMLGYTEAELRESVFAALVHPDDRAENLREVHRLLRGEKPFFELQNRYCSKSGEPVWVHKFVSLLRDEAGSPAHLVALATNVTERLRTERGAAFLSELSVLVASLNDGDEIARAAGERLQHFFRASRVTLADVDVASGEAIIFSVGDASVPPGVRVRQSLAACLTAAAMAELAAGRMLVVDDTASDPRTAAFAATYAQWQIGSMMLVPCLEEERWTFLLALQRREASRWETDEAELLREATQRVCARLGRARAETALAAAKERAEMANAAKDKFIAALSHELRTPLTPVLMVAAAHGRSPHLPPELRDDFTMIRQNIETEARLIDDLLDIARIAQGKLQLLLGPCDVHEVIDRVARMLASEIAARQLSLQIECLAPACIIRGDSLRLQQVVWNLLRNAAKFTPSGGAITVRTGNHGGELRLSVADTGIGISARDLARIFGAFEQAHAGVAPEYGGLGLGLSISASIVSGHGGRIWAESGGVGRGATFHVALPLAEVIAHAAAGATAPDSGREPGRKRILIVEDHAPTRSALVRLLALRGHAVSEAASMAEARRMGGEGSYDVVISDLGLPDGDGRELIREFRDRYATPGIALSGYGMDDDVRDSTEAGAGAHLVKPVTIEALERTLATVSEFSARG